MQDIQELKPPFVMSIYLQFVKITLNASLTNMKMIGLNCTDHMQRYPEAYEKAILMPRVARVLAWFFNLYAGDDSFTFGDLMNPKADRTRHFFNTIINFVIEYGETKDKLDAIWEELEEKKERLASGRERRAARLQVVTEQLAECQIQEEEMVKHTNALSADVGQKQALKAKLREELDGIKQKVAELTSLRQSADLFCIELEEQRDQLLLSVVSHEELQEVQQREAKLKETHLDLNDKKKQLNDMGVILAAKERMLGLFSNHIQPLVDDLSQQLQEIESVSCLEDISDRGSRARSVRDEAEHQMSVLQQRLATLTETKRAASQQWGKKKQGIEADMRASREMIEQLRTADQGREAAERGLEEELLQTERCLASLSRQEEELMAYWDRQYGLLTTAMEQHNIKTHAGLQALLQELKKRPSLQ